MNIDERLNMVTLLLQDAEESIIALTNYKLEHGFFPSYWTVGTLDSKGNVIKRIEVARDQLLKIKKELLGELE